MRWAAGLACAGALFAAESGETLYAQHCSACHGPKGQGGKAAKLAAPRLARARTDADLYNLIRFGIAGTEMPASSMSDDEAKRLMSYVRELGRMPPPPGSGDPARGAELFRTKGGCGRCHMLAGRGARPGPELTDVGARRGAPYLRESLLDPQASVPESFIEYRRLRPQPDNFLLVRVTTADGREVTGVRLNEDAFTIQLRDFDDRFHHFEKSELKELRKEWGRSPMPSFREVFTKQELDDVVAYLSSLRGDR